MIIQFIIEAFEAYGTMGLKAEQILDVVVEINGDIKIR